MKEGCVSLLADRGGSLKRFHRPNLFKVWLQRGLPRSWAKKKKLQEGKLVHIPFLPQRQEKFGIKD
jgi:hypothetical protein